MQVTTVQKMQKVLDKFIKVCKFVWRHAFVLFFTYPLILGLLEGKTPILSVVIKYIAVAAIVDWIKMKIKIKFKGGYQGTTERSKSFSEQNYWNSEVIGTPAYVSSIGSSSSSSSYDYYR
jgi:hypothetical protein